MELKIDSIALGCFVLSKLLLDHVLLYVAFVVVRFIYVHIVRNQVIIIIPIPLCKFDEIYLATRIKRIQK
jgi:hypothetical protein